MTTTKERFDFRELRAWLGLWRTPGFGPAAFSRLLEALPGLADAVELPAAELERLGVDPKVAAGLADIDWSAVDADLRWLEADNHHLIRWGDPLYPPLLAEIGAAPPLLFVVGDPGHLSLPQLAMVGSRNPSAGGRDTAYDFAAHLAAAGLAITSGLALGIDTAVHRGALDGGGVTIAVTATGPDRIYPARNRDLAHAIAEHGALVTEFPTGTGVRADQFPRRNRIISGLSLGTLVVEASLRSGSLITARYALEQGREILAIPGSIHNPLSKGCHRLIRQGAKLVETAEDVLEELPPVEHMNTAPAVDDSTPQDEALDEEYQQVLAALGHDPVPVDLIVQRTGLTPGAVSSMLLVLELKGLVAAANGGRYARIGTRQ